MGALCLGAAVSLPQAAHDSANTLAHRQHEARLRSAYESPLQYPQRLDPQQPIVQHPANQSPLARKVNSMSIGILFMLLVWRNLSVYELADQFVSKRMRLLTLPPLVAILLSNLLGFLMNVMRPHGFKNLLKLILATNISRECVELVYNVAMVFSRSRYSSIPRDVYVGRFFMNVWWTAFCLSFSRSRWVAGSPPTGSRGKYL